MSSNSKGLISNVRAQARAYWLDRECPQQWPSSVVDLRGILVAKPVAGTPMECGAGVNVDLDKWSLTGHVPDPDPDHLILVDERTLWVLRKMGRTDVVYASVTRLVMYARHPAASTEAALARATDVSALA